MDDADIAHKTQSRVQLLLYYLLSVSMYYSDKVVVLEREVQTSWLLLDEELKA